MRRQSVPPLLDAGPRGVPVTQAGAVPCLRSLISHTTNAVSPSASTIQALAHPSNSPQPPQLRHDHAPPYRRHAVSGPAPPAHPFPAHLLPSQPLLRTPKGPHHHRPYRAHIAERGHRDPLQCVARAAQARRGGERRRARRAHVADHGGQRGAGGGQEQGCVGPTWVWLMADYGQPL